MIKISYFNERELLVKRDKNKDTEAKGTQVIPFLILLGLF